MFSFVLGSGALVELILDLVPCEFLFVVLAGVEVEVLFVVVLILSLLELVEVLLAVLV